MSQSTKLFAGVVVLAALGGAIYYAKNKDAQIGTSSTTSAELPEIKAPDEVDKISVKNGEKDEIVLEKKDDKWTMTKPVAAPANQGNVDQLVKNLKDLKAKEVIVGAASDESKKDYDFVPEKGVHVIAYKGGDKKLNLDLRQLRPARPDGDGRRQARHLRRDGVLELPLHARAEGLP